MWFDRVTYHVLEMIMVPIDYNERKIEDLLYYLYEKLS